MSKKYIIWISNNRGDFVWADEVKEENGIVLFRNKEGTIIESYNLKNIQEYSEIKTQNETQNY